MATASSTPTGQDSDTSILHLFVEFILKKREKGLNAAAIVEALAGPSSVGSSATRRRTTSESRKAQRSTSVRPSTTSAARAHRNIGTGVVKAPKYVSFEEYHLKYAVKSLRTSVSFANNPFGLHLKVYHTIDRPSQ